MWLHAGVQLCDWPEPVPEKWETSGESSLEMDTPEPIQQVIKILGGCPRVCDCKREYLVTPGLPEQDKDHDEGLGSFYTISHKKKRLRGTINTSCPSCDFVAVKGMDLYRHIKDLHPDACKYGCWDCDKFFQTDHDHLNHMNLVHCDKVFQCTQCSFTATVESRIKSNVHTHSTKKV